MKYAIAFDQKSFELVTPSGRTSGELIDMVTPFDEFFLKYLQRFPLHTGAVLVGEGVDAELHLVRFAEDFVHDLAEVGKSLGMVLGNPPEDEVKYLIKNAGTDHVGQKREVRHLLILPVDIEVAE